MNRFEFDLAFAMTLVLTPLRIFTKFVQNRDAVTLAHVPHLIDELVTKLAPNAFTQHLISCAEGVVNAMNAFQAALVTSIKNRYEPMFNTASLARTAAFFLPGRLYRDFANFPNDDEDDIVLQIKERLASDAADLLPPNDPKRERTARRARAAVDDIREDLDELDPTDNANDPLIWIPLHSKLPVLFPIAMLYLAIPSTSSEDERNFSSAGITLDKLRSRMDIENFRLEHRIRRYLTAGSDAQSQDGRKLRQIRVKKLISLFYERYGVVRT